MEITNVYLVWFIGFCGGIITGYILWGLYLKLAKKKINLLEEKIDGRD